MREETTTFDRKSLKTVQGKNPEWEELAKDCVAFANARGGHIFIGIENDSELPPSGQSILESLPGKVQLRLSQITINTSVLTTVVTPRMVDSTSILQFSQAFPPSPAPLTANTI